MTENRCRTRRTAALCLTVIVPLLLSGCDSSIGEAVKAPVTSSAATIAVTVTGGPDATVTVTQTVTGSREAVTQTVTETADPVETSTSSSASNPTGLKVGGAGFTAEDDDGAATITVVSVQRKTAGNGADKDPPKNGNYLLIEISYQCTSGKFDYNQFDWTVRDKDGRTFDSGDTYPSGYTDGALHSGTLAKGAKGRGLVVFDVPKGALSLEYENGYDQVPASWSIPA